MLNILLLSSDNNNQLITFIFAWSFTVRITNEGLMGRDNICVSSNSNNSQYKAFWHNDSKQTANSFHETRYAWLHSSQRCVKRLWFFGSTPTYLRSKIKDD